MSDVFHIWKYSWTSFYRNRTTPLFYLEKIEYSNSPGYIQLKSLPWIHECYFCPFEPRYLERGYVFPVDIPKRKFGPFESRYFERRYVASNDYHHRSGSFLDLVKDKTVLTKITSQIRACK
jgi:hypothetical protein